MLSYLLKPGPFALSHPPLKTEFVCHFTFLFVFQTVSFGIITIVSPISADLHYSKCKIYIIRKFTGSQIHHELALTFSYITLNFINIDDSPILITPSPITPSKETTTIIGTVNEPTQDVKERAGGKKGSTCM